MPEHSRCPPDLDRPDSRGPWVPPSALLGIAAAVMAAYGPSLDNFFTADDFSLLFQALKVTHHPDALLAPFNGFLRYNQLGFFVVNLHLFGPSPLAFMLGLLVIHSANAVLVALFLGRLSGDRLIGILGGLFWALSYRISEVVLRPYAVADSLALLFGITSLLLVLERRHLLAAVLLVAALFSKENAVVFPLLATLMVASEGRRAAVRTLPLWSIAGLYAVAVAVARSGSSQYLVPDQRMLSRFWECWLTLVGPDASWLRQVVLNGAPTLLPAWLAVVLFLPFGWLLWRLPRLERFGLLFSSVAVLPTLALVFQTSRYSYLPMVGVAAVVGSATVRAHRHLTTPRPRPAARAVLWSLAVLIGAYLVLGIRHDEQDIDRHGELYRVAAVSFAADVAPLLERDPQTMVVFARTPNLEMARSMFLPRPWYQPETYKWVYRRSYGVLGLANTYGFVSYCTAASEPPALFVAVPRSEYEQRIAVDPLQLVVHDSGANRFWLAEPAAVSALRRRAVADGLYETLQPGCFDPDFEGEQDL